MKTVSKKFSLLLCSALILSSNVMAETIVLRFGAVLDGDRLVKDATVVIESERIRSVSTGPGPTGVRVIDLSRYTAIPGLIDAHTHVTYYWDRSPGTRPWSQLGTLGSAVTVFLAQENARKTLETGVTTMRDLGSIDYMDIAMRDLINRDAMIGPRMFVSGYGLYISSTPSKTVDVPPDPGQADGIDQVQKVARQQIAAGADWIKMYASTGSDKDVTGFQTFTFEEIKAAVEIAHNAGKRIAVHSYGPDAARDAVRAGADSVEHATDMDDRTISDMAAKGVFYVPTVDHNRYYIDHREEFGYDEKVIEGLRGYIERNFKTLQKAVRAGVKIAMGSDAVFTGFGENTRELEWFVKAGMSPAQALATATANGASLLGMEKDLGRIAPGFYADIVAIEGDPLKEIDSVIKGVRWVMKAGKVVVDNRSD